MVHLPSSVLPCKQFLVTLGKAMLGETLPALPLPQNPAIPPIRVPFLTIALLIYPQERHRQKLIVKAASALLPPRLLP